MKRLEFVLPSFTRVSWVSDQAREVWEPRLGRIASAWSEIEWLSVALGIRRCGVIMVSAEDFVGRAGDWLKRGLAAFPVEIVAPGNYSRSMAKVDTQLGKRLVFRFVLGMPRDVSHFRSAYDASNDRDIGRLLGCPPCCREFFRAVWVEQALEDTTWPMALATAGVPGGTNRTEVTGPPETNILWRWLGVRAVPHLPCRFDCHQTVQLGKKFLAVGRGAGYEDEMDWLLDVLSWPVEWSALHGIAEIKTPVLKVSTQTDATAQKYVVRRRGNGYPSDGAWGLNFPFRTRHQPLLTSSSGFQRGLDNPIVSLSTSTERNVTSTRSMRDLHSRRIEETVVEQLMTRHPSAPPATVNIADICTGDYLAAVELTDGRQGVATNLFNVHGPHRAAYNYVHYDSLLIHISKTDRLLQATFLRRTGLDPLGQAVKLAILNALSSELLSPDRMRAHGLQLAEGVLDIAALLREDDIVGMIGCIGNYSCWPVGSNASLKRIYFSDFEYTEPYKAEVEGFIRRVFHYPDKVSISNGADNMDICARSDVLILTSDTLCTNTLDDLLRGCKTARHVLMVGRSYAMDPVPLFAKGVTGLTTQRILHPKIVSSVRQKLQNREFGFTESLKGHFKELSVLRYQ